ncbi:MAG: hypothetical protein IJA88_00945 [Clostridia bacterium]|nr:hypothetical protein [Clostridia bacterium]
MKKRNRFIVLLSFIFLLSIAFSGIFATANVSAATIVPTVFRMQQGASIRVGEKNGLRFSAEVDETTVLAVTEDEQSCFGALIVPYDYFDKYGVSTENGTDFVKAFADAGANVQTKDNLTVSSKKASGLHLVACSITNLNYQNYNREFFGVVYIKTATETTGEFNYTYAWIYSDTTTRSADYVAYKTYQEYVDVAEEDELSMLKTYIANGYLENGEISKEDLETAVNELLADQTEFDNVIAEYETKEFKSVLENLPQTTEEITMYHGEYLAKLDNLYNSLSDTADANLSTEIALYQELKEYYDERYELLSSNTRFYNGATGTWAAVYTVKDDYVEGYGKVTRIDVHAPEDGVSAQRNLRINVYLNDIKAYLSENADISAVRFGIKTTQLSQNYNLLDNENRFIINDEWSEFTFTREQISNGENNGVKVIELPYGKEQTLYFTEVFAISSSAIAKEVSAMIEKLPQDVADVDVFDGEMLNETYTLYSSLDDNTKALIDAQSLKTVKEYYDERYVMSNTTTRSWLTSVNSGTYSSQYIPVLEEDVVYGTVVRLDIAQATSTTDNTKNFRVTIPMSNIKTALNEDTSIVEIKFALWSSATTRTFDFNGTSGFKLTQNAWTECVLTREQALNSNGNLSYGDLVKSSAQTVKISSIYLVRDSAIVGSVIEKINALPQTVEEIKFYHGNIINEAYNEYTALSSEYQALVTNASVLTTIKEYYDAHYEVMCSETSVWLNNGKTSNYAGVGTMSLYEDTTYGTVVKCEVEKATETTNSDRYSVVLPNSFLTAIKNDTSITEIKFMFRSSKAISGGLIFVGSYLSCNADEWTEYTISRDVIISKDTVRFSIVGLTKDSAQTVYFTNFYAVKTVAE